MTQSADPDKSQRTWFADFAGPAAPLSPLRTAITDLTRSPEPDRVAALLAEAAMPPDAARRARETACHLIGTLRAKGSRSVVQALVREYDLSSQEGIALMCLAEALLRIPDRPTRDALIRDKIAGGDWRSHLGHGGSLFVNAATWGLIVSGRLVTAVDEGSLGVALSRLLTRGGEPVIRRGVDIAIRLMGEQFVTGQTIEEALRNSRRLETRGFHYSYDMLGEAAATADDAARYMRDYAQAIHATGRHAAGRGPYGGPGVSVKLSALHPRCSRAQRARVMTELLPRLRALAGLARQYDIGLNIDAEEADRLELSLDLLEALCLDPALHGWNGIGFVVQAYGKRASPVIDWLIELAHRSDHRLMIRLVKGAYWDSEIKRAQQDGLEDFPVFTRKLHTDVSYLACARKLLDARTLVFPQFATHNAQTLAAVLAMAGDAFQPGDYEFQCLHGMGEPLYEEVAGPTRLNRPVRIYAPVGAHETLLAYLVRRLLENGANASFVNQIQNPSVTVDELAANPVALVAAERPVGAPNERIRLPQTLFAPQRPNSAGLDLNDENRLRALAPVLAESVRTTWLAGPSEGPAHLVRNPADPTDVIGRVVTASASTVEVALARAAAAQVPWQDTPPLHRTEILLQAAGRLEQEMAKLLGLIVREAGKTLPNAVAEVREAVDLLRYYAAEVRERFDNTTHRPLGPVACISPWNFPLAIFTGQVAAALAAGNVVLAKPAEETPLIAAQAIAILHAAGVPTDALQLLCGDGTVGAALVADPRIRGVVFTGSTEVAQRIQQCVAMRLNPDCTPVPLIAETGGQNALVVDSSALPEQVVADVIASAFDSAGQRCSALRILCLQDDVADRILAMLKGAMVELAVGSPDRLATDIGPVISAAARDGILRHIKAMRCAGRPLHMAPCPVGAGFFVPPTLIELADVAQLRHEVFGPVLHVVRFHRRQLNALIDAIGASGYALTFGLHSRLGGVARHVTDCVKAGNVYVNRTITGAVVGVQPFGGHGLSGTGPKAGGPLYLRRLLSAAPPETVFTTEAAPLPFQAWRAWLAEAGHPIPDRPTPTGVRRVLPGPVGEENVYRLQPRGTVLCHASSAEALREQIGVALLTGNRALISAGALDAGLSSLSGWILVETAPLEAGFDVVLFEGTDVDLRALAQRIAGMEGPIRPIHVAAAGTGYPLEWLVAEQSISTNTAAAGGNAQLMAIG